MIRYLCGGKEYVYIRIGLISDIMIMISSISFKAIGENVLVFRASVAKRV